MAKGPRFITCPKCKHEFEIINRKAERLEAEIVELKATIALMQGYLKKGKSDYSKDTGLDFFKNLFKTN